MIDELTRAAALDAYRRVTPDAFRLLAERSGGRAQDVDGLLLAEGPDPVGEILNVAFRLDPTIPASFVLEAARVHFGPRRVRFALWVLAGRDDDLAAAADATGWRRAIDLPAMVIAARPVEAAVDGAEMRMVEDGRDRASFAAIAAGAMADSDAERDAYLGALQAPALFRDCCRAVIVRAGATDAAVAWVTVIGDAGLVGWVGTRRDYRRRGLGAWATAAVTNAAFDLGASWVVLQASPMGQPVYAAMGYEVISHETLWLPPVEHQMPAI